jgi:hypothetical protein
MPKLDELSQEELQYLLDNLDNLKPAELRALDVETAETAEDRKSVV